MAAPLELELFMEEFDQIESLPDASRWKVERDNSVPLGLFATMHPISEPTNPYKARIRWKNYFAPFSLKFVSLETNADNDPTAWPQCYGFRPSSLDACLPWTEEGHALHPEWRNSAMHSFPSVEVPMQYALLRVQHALDSTYAGRGSR